VAEDLKFYTKVSISRATKTTDLPDATFADVAKQLAGANVYDEASVRERIAELERQRGVILEKPSQMGMIDQTPKSATTLALAAVSMGERKTNILATTSLLHMRHRLLMVYTYRVFETAKDPTILQDFTKEWVRSSLAANP